MKVALVILSLMALTAHSFGNDIEEGLSESELKVVTGNGQFANNVYKSLAREEGNVLFSPISAHACLSMLYQGAGGSTKEACANGLQVADPETAAEGYSKLMQKINNAKDLTVAIANKAYVSDKNHIKSGFKNAVEDKFKAEIESLDFTDTSSAINTINTWVKEKTKEKIPKLLQEGDVTPSTNLVLVNAVYFKGTWLHTFQKDETQTEKFYLDGNNQVDVQMMHLAGKFFSYKNDQDLNAQIMHFPYTDGDYSMVIILPNKKDGLAEMEGKLVQRDLSKILEGAENREPYVSLPKFKVEQHMYLKKTLKEVGLGEIFEATCDLSGMLEETNVQVGEVIQKTYIQVDEIGSEAAAATAIIGVGAALIPEDQKPHFVADHPFVFLLVHGKENANPSALNVLFYGRVKKPEL